MSCIKITVVTSTEWQPLSPIPHITMDSASEGICPDPELAKSTSVQTVILGDDVGTQLAPKSSNTLIMLQDEDSSSPSSSKFLEYLSQDPVQYFNDIPRCQLSAEDIKELVNTLRLKGGRSKAKSREESRLTIKNADVCPVCDTMKAQKSILIESAKGRKGKSLGRQRSSKCDLHVQIAKGHKVLPKIEAGPSRRASRTSSGTPVSQRRSASGNKPGSRTEVRKSRTQMKSPVGNRRSSTGSRTEVRKSRTQMRSPVGNRAEVRRSSTGSRAGGRPRSRTSISSSRTGLKNKTGSQTAVRRSSSGSRSGGRPRSRTSIASSKTELRNKAAGKPAARRSRSLKTASATSMRSSRSGSRTSLSKSRSGSRTRMTSRPGSPTKTTSTSGIASLTRSESKLVRSIQPSFTQQEETDIKKRAKDKKQSEVDIEKEGSKSSRWRRWSRSKSTGSDISDDSNKVKEDREVARVKKPLPRKRSAPLSSRTSIVTYNRAGPSRRSASYSRVPKRKNTKPLSSAFDLSDAYKISLFLVSYTLFTILR